MATDINNLPIGDKFLEDARSRGWFWDFNEVLDSDLSIYAKMVRIYLARCADRERKAWPSLATIAKHCGIGRQTVIRAIKTLIDEGWLRKETRRTESGEYLSTVYYLEDPPKSCSREESATGTGGIQERQPPMLSEESTTGTGSPTVGQPPTSGEAGGPSRIEPVLGPGSAREGRRGLSGRQPSSRVETAVVSPVDGGGVSQRRPLSHVETTVVSDVDTNNTQYNNTHYNKTQKNNTQRTTVREKEELFPSEKDASAFDASQLSDRDSPGSVPQSTSPSPVKEQTLPGGEEGGAPGGFSPPTNKDLIAELTEMFHRIPGIEPLKGHYQLVGRAYNEFGYETVLDAIEQMGIDCTARKLSGKPPWGEKELWSKFFWYCRWVKKPEKPPKRAPEGDPEPEDDDRDLEDYEVKAWRQIYYRDENGRWQYDAEKHMELERFLKAERARRRKLGEARAAARPGEGVVGSASARRTL